MWVSRDSRTGIKATTLEAWLRKWHEQNEGRLSALEAWRTVPYVRRGVDLLAGAVSQQPFCIYRGGKKIATEKDYRRGDLGFDVNFRTLTKNLTLDLLVFGYAHWGLVGLDGYQVVKRRAARYIRYDLDTGNAVYRIEYRRGTYSQVAFRWTPMGEGGLPFVWEEGENDERPGTPKVFSALKAAGVLNSIADYGMFFFDGGGAGPLIFQFEGYENAPKAEQERVQGWLDRFAKGVKNAFRPLAMGGNVEVHKAGHSVRELEMPELSREKREDVLAALGVPVSLVLPAAANYATANEDKFTFHDATVNPVFQQIADAINERWLNPLDMEIVAEPERLQVYQDKELERSEKLIPMVQSGIISADEAREETGREPRGGSAGYEDDATVEQARERLALPAADEALRKWRAKAVKRWKEGTPDKALEFESEHLTPATKAAVIGALEAAATVEDVEAAFEGAEVWVGYG